MKLKFTLLALALILFATMNLNAQFENPDVEDFGQPTERYLGYPNTSEGTQLIPVGIDLWSGNENNTIHYGQIPANSSNKPVVVFVHGYASNAHVFFEGDDNMYWDVYRDGYRSAFVSLTPNKHMWTNGNMLSNMIDKITAHYGVDEVIVVGWSKGGVDTDAAIVHFGANDKVSQAFTLSTPHHGTGIAELANSILLSLVNIIFMQDNDATVCLQRGYMSYFRSITNNNSNNTVPYTTIGGYGDGPLARLSIPQGYLYLAGGSKSSGGNDGVVPYSSSKRPGGNELFGGLKKYYGFLGIPYYDGPDETDLDHYEVTRGGLVWPHIKANINSSNRVATNLTEDDYNPNAIVKSNMQLVTSQKGMQHFVVEEGVKKVMIIMGQATQAVNFSVKSNTGQVLQTKQSINERLTDQTFKTVYEINVPNSGKFTIDTEEEFAAVILTEGGIEAQLNTGLPKGELVHKTGEAFIMSLNLTDASNQPIQNALVTGMLTRTSDLKLQKTTDEPVVVAFNSKNGEFVANVDQQLPAGIYQVMVNAEGKGFKKQVLTSIAIVGKTGVEEVNTPNLDFAIANTYPNPFQGNLTIELTGIEKNTELTVYNIFGQQVKAFDLAGQKGNVKVEWNAAKDRLESGIYIVQLSDGENKVTKKVMMK